MMKYRQLYWGFILGAFFVLLSWGSAVFADDLQVSGAGTSAINGCYHDTGMQDIGHVWQHATSSYYILSAGIAGIYIECRITDDPDDTYPQPGAQYYYKRTPADVICTSALAAGGSYTIGTGASAAPTVSETTCAPPPTPPPSVATTSSQMIVEMPVIMLISTVLAVASSVYLGMRLVGAFL